MMTELRTCYRHGDVTMNQWVFDDPRPSPRHFVCPMDCPVETFISPMSMSLKWMVKDAAWNSVVPVPVWRCTGWFHTNFLWGKVENSGCITLTHRWSCTKLCRSEALWAKLQHSLALMFQTVSMLRGALSKAKDCQSLRQSLPLEGVTPLVGANHLQKDLEGLGLADDVIQNLSLERVPCLHILTFGHSFNQSLQGVTLPSRLQSLTFERL